MTNQQGAPEALRPIQRYKIGYHTDEWGVRSSTPGGISDPSGQWVLYKDHVAALVDAQQPSPTPQPDPQQPAPSAAVALSDDLRDRLVAISAAIADQDDRAAQAMLREILAAPQPSTTPPADSHPAPVLLSDEELCQIEEPYLLNFRIPLGGQYDFARAVEKAVLAKTYGTQAPQPSPTPQAESQPAPVPTSATDGDWTQPTTVALRLGDAMQLLCGGKRPPDDMVQQWLDNTSESLQEFAVSYGPAWAQGIGLIDAAMVMVDQPTEIRTIDNPDRDHEHRAASARADSVTAPAATVIKKGADRQWMSERLGHLPDGIYSLYLAPPTKAADSVLEDAARLDWLDQQCEAYGFQDIHEGNRWEISGAYANVREAIDAERAARKQGGAT